MRWVRWATAALAVVGGLGLGTVRAGAASSSGAAVGALSTAPAYGGDFPDPDVVAIPGGYAAYATGTGGANLQVMTSPDLRSWSRPVDPLPVLPPWAGRGETWAPGVVRLGWTWVMYYTAFRPATGFECIGVATSVAPTGPFVDRSTAPLICQPRGSIDPSPYVAPGGQTYLVWKEESPQIGGPSHIWSQPIAAGGRSLAGTPSLLLSATQGWQDETVEGPDMVSDGDMTVLFYGANHWNTAGSAIGYALCTTPMGPCANVSVGGGWLASDSRVVGPQGPSAFTGPDGQTYLAYASWSGGVGYDHGGRRTLWIDRLGFVAGLPVLGY